MIAIAMLILQAQAAPAPKADASVLSLRLAVKDVAASSAFYQSALGFTSDWCCPLGNAAELRNGNAHYRLERCASAGDAAATDWQTYMNYQVADLSAAAAALRAAGGRVDQDEPMAYPLGLLYSFRDPDGHPGTILTVEMSPLAAGTPPQAFTLSLPVRDMTRSEAFYRDLGFQVTSRDYLPHVLPLQPKGAFPLLLHQMAEGETVTSGGVALILTVPDVAAAKAHVHPGCTGACCSGPDLLLSDPAGNSLVIRNAAAAGAAPAPSQHAAAEPTASRVSGGDGRALPAAAAFERLKDLAGTWQAKSTQGWTGTETFELIAGGSVLMQTTRIEPHPDDTMVTLYCMDGDRLLLTHYCMAKNQPRMQASDISADGRRIGFTFLDGTGMKSRDQGHMDAASFELIDHDHFRDQWTWYQDGKSSWMEQVDYVRTK